MNEKRVPTTRSSRGFTLAEMIIATAVLALVSGAIFALLFQSQDAYQSQQSIVQITQQSRIAMDQVLRFFRQAGNDPEEIFAGISPPGGHTHSGLYPIEILSSAPDWQIQINSDITGSVPDGGGDPLDATGDPDGTLTNLYERVTVRYDSSTDEFYLNLGYGEELLAEGISAFNLTFFDGAGNEITNPAANEDAIVQVKAQLASQTTATARTDIQSITLESDVFLRSKSFDLFAQN